MRWFYALLCFAMLHWVFGAKRGFDPHSHCNWCTSGVWFHQAIGRKSPLQSAVIHKKDLLEQVLLFYILFFDGLCDPSFMRSLHLQVCQALFYTRTKDCPPMYCFLSIRQWLDWETSQTWLDSCSSTHFGSFASASWLPCRSWWSSCTPSCLCPNPSIAPSTEQRGEPQQRIQCQFQASLSVAPLERTQLIRGIRWSDTSDRLSSRLVV